MAKQEKEDKLQYARGAYPVAAMFLRYKKAIFKHMLKYAREKNWDITQVNTWFRTTDPRLTSHKGTTRCPLDLMNRRSIGVLHSFVVRNFVVSDK